MWISNSKQWNDRVTPLEKFVVERIIQRCDYNESISNKHRTTNGYTQLKELIHYCELSTKRSKTIKTLVVILDEAKSNIIKQNISSDYIINHYFKDLKDFIEAYDLKTLEIKKGQPNLVVLENLSHKLKIYEKQLDSQYYKALKEEFLKVDYNDVTKIERDLSHISNLIDLLIPQLIFSGYSLATITEILKHWYKCKYHIKASNFLSFIHFNTRPFYFLQYLGPDNQETKDFFNLMKDEFNDATLIKSQDIKPRTNDALKDLKKRIQKSDLFANYSYNTLDPHTHVREYFDKFLKNIVIKKERQSLAIFNEYFTNSFWSNKLTKPYKYFKNINLEGDPINVLHRGKTLRNTLINSSVDFNFCFNEDSPIPQVKTASLYNAIYYYNLALGSKSIENSLSLLWTSIEAIQPCKIYSSDIEAIQNFLPKALAIGAVSRDIYALANRMNHTQELYSKSFDKLKENPLLLEKFNTSKGLNQWFDWLTNTSECISNFDTLKSASELLAYQYIKLSKSYITDKNKKILERIEGSELSMKYQLQRIYLHRNKIVHSGDLINEYTNLWMHLEWYIGKILAFFIIESHYVKKEDSLYSIFIGLNADYEYICSYLKKNQNVEILKMPKRIREILFKYSWQSY